ncbi:MAG: hypothetical protein L0H41_17170, partial [Microlunatus sp.]|nr:hypothetical protein [Microlunatus sp.]
MSTRGRVTGMAVALVLGLLMSLSGSAAHAAGTADPNGCRAPKVPVASSTLTCPEESTPAPGASAPPAPKADPPAGD